MELALVATSRQLRLRSPRAQGAFGPDQREHPKAPAQYPRQVLKLMGC